MKDKELAKMIIDYMAWWDLEFDDKDKNYKETIKALKNKKTAKDIYDYLYSENETGATYNTIINELKTRF